MPAVVVVVGEVAGDVLSGLAAVGGFGDFEFGLDGAEAGFHEGVVVAVSGPAHALAKLRSAEDGPIGLPGVLPGRGAVMDQNRSRPRAVDFPGAGRGARTGGH